MCGCSNCKYCHCYRGDYWTPNEYECQMPDNDYGLSDKEMDDMFTEVWVNGKMWDYNEKPLCPAWVEAPSEIDDYWDEYAYKERYKEDR